MSLAHRVYADEQTRALFELAAELSDKELRPAAAAAESVTAVSDAARWVQSQVHQPNEP